MLYHEGSLSDCLEALTTAASASRWRSSWLRSAALARVTDIGATESHCFTCAVYCVHEFNFHIKDDVLSLGLLSGFLTSWTSFTAKHLFELFKDVAKGCLACSWSLAASELLREAFKASKALSKGTATATEGSLSTEGVLLLLITSHTSLVVYTPFVLVAQGLVCVVDLRKLLFSFRRLVNIRMVLLCQLEVGFLNISCRGTARYS